MTTEKNLSPDQDGQSRRRFIYNVGTALGTGMVLGMPGLAEAAKFVGTRDQYTVKQVMDLFIQEVHGAPFPGTVDTLKSGSPDTLVTGIVTTMFATIDVIRKAIDLGANFIIAHEPTFYNHEDKTDWLKNDDVFQFKMDLLNSHQIAVWRNHDDIHQLKPDGVTKGVLMQLGWEKYADATLPNVITLPASTLKDIIGHTKEKLHIEKVRYIGDLDTVGTKVLFIPGAAGGRMHIQGIGKYKPEVLICGEISEWETAEYVRDARAKGDHISLVVLGHIASEEPGSEFMFNWLKEHIPAIKTTHVPCGNSLSFF